MSGLTLGLKLELELGLATDVGVLRDIDVV